MAPPAAPFAVLFEEVAVAAAVVLAAEEDGGLTFVGEEREEERFLLRQPQPSWTTAAWRNRSFHPSDDDMPTLREL